MGVGVSIAFVMQLRRLTALSRQRKRPRHGQSLPIVCQETAAALVGDDVLVKLSHIPVPPLFMGEVFSLVVCSVEIAVNLYAHINRHSLSVDLYGNLHNRSSIQIFWSEWGGGGKRQRGTINAKMPD